VMGLVGCAEAGRWEMALCRVKVPSRRRGLWPRQSSAWKFSPCDAPGFMRSTSLRGSHGTGGRAGACVGIQCPRSQPVLKRPLSESRTHDRHRRHESWLHLVFGTDQPGVVVGIFPPNAHSIVDAVADLGKREEIG